MYPSKHNLEFVQVIKLKRQTTGDKYVRLKVTKFDLNRFSQPNLIVV